MTNSFSPDELDQLQNLRNSVANFEAVLDPLPDDMRSVEHNQQFNRLRIEAKTLLKGSFTEDVPRAVTGDVSRDRSITLVVMFGVILVLVGLGINSIVIEDVLLISLGCCVSSGGMLLVLGGFGVLAQKTYRERISTVQDLRQHTDLLLYQIDHRLQMSGAAEQPAQINIPSESGVPPGRPEAGPPVDPQAGPGPTPYDPPESPPFGPPEDF